MPNRYVKHPKHITAYVVRMSLLKDRMKQALVERRKADKAASQAGLAKASGVSRATVTDWFNGKTKNIRGEHLPAAARYLNVNPLWLATGEGSRERTGALAVNERTSLYQLEARRALHELRDEIDALRASAEPERALDERMLRAAVAEVKSVIARHKLKRVRPEAIAEAIAESYLALSTPDQSVEIANKIILKIMRAKSPT